ncbi:MAG: hypothetical protein ACPGN3_14070 [Opitutales bacterium]
MSRSPCSNYSLRRLALVSAGLNLLSTSNFAQTLYIDFGDDNQSYNIDVSNGKNWNTISPDALPQDLKIGNGATGTDSGFDITLGSDWANTSTNAIDNNAFRNTAFNENQALSRGAEFDALRANDSGAAASFTISGFDPDSTLEIQLAAACKDGGAANVVDFIFDGSEAEEGSVDFDVYANSQKASGTGAILTWYLSGKSAYTFTMSPEPGDTGAINGMIITVLGDYDPDTDSDGLTDSIEEALGTDKAKPDTDNDGLPDGKEVNELATNPLSPYSESDGMHDLVAYALDANSFSSRDEANPAFSHAANQYSFSIAKTEATGVAYTVEVSEDLKQWYRVAQKDRRDSWILDDLDDASPAYNNIENVQISTSSTGVVINTSDSENQLFYRTQFNYSENSVETSDPTKRLDYTLFGSDANNDGVDDSDFLAEGTYTNQFAGKFSDPAESDWITLDNTSGDFTFNGSNGLKKTAWMGSTLRFDIKLDPNYQNTYAPRVVIICMQSGLEQKISIDVSDQIKLDSHHWQRVEVPFVQEAENEYTYNAEGQITGGHYQNLFSEVIARNAGRFKTIRLSTYEEGVPSRSKFKLRKVGVYGTFTWEIGTTGTYTGSLPYRVSKKTNLDSGTKIPAFIYLHGKGGGDNAINTNTWWSAYERPLAVTKHSTYIFEPKNGKSTGSLNSGQLNTFLDYIIANYNVDADRIYLGGHSAGGIETSRFVKDHGDRLAGAYTTHGAMITNYNNLNFSKATGMNIYLTSADNDNTVKPAESTIPFYNKLVEYNANPILRIYETGGHSQNVARDYTPTMFDHLFSGRRQ